MTFRFAFFMYTMKYIFARQKEEKRNGNKYLQIKPKMFFSGSFFHDNDRENSVSDNTNHNNNSRDNKKRIYDFKWND